MYWTSVFHIFSLARVIFEVNSYMFFMIFSVIGWKINIPSGCKPRLDCWSLLTRLMFQWTWWCVACFFICLGTVPTPAEKVPILNRHSWKTRPFWDRNSRKSKGIAQENEQTNNSKIVCIFDKFVQIRLESSQMRSSLVIFYFFLTITLWFHGFLLFVWEAELDHISAWNWRQNMWTTHVESYQFHIHLIQHMWIPHINSTYQFHIL